MSEQTTKNKKFVLIAGILAVGILAASIAGGQLLNATAQYAPNSAGTSTNSTVSTSGTATVKVQADKVTVNVAVETNGTTASEAVARNAEISGQVIAALKELGITEDQISTSYFSVYPVYEWVYPPCIMEGDMKSESGASGAVRPEIYPPPPECQGKNVITGYKASNNLSVTLDADENVGEVIDTAVGAGANNVSGAYFFISQERQQELRDSLIAEAIANAEHRATIAANAVDMKISGVQSISLNDVYFPVFYKGLESFDAGAGTQILPGQQEVTTTVSVVFFIS
jgi:uncharacterized protein